MINSFKKLGLICATVLLIQVSSMYIDAVSFNYQRVNASSIDTPLEKIDKTMDAVGNLNMLVFKVDFADVKYAENTLSADEIEKKAFGEEGITSISYPMESISAYYKRASYNKLNLSGKVYEYTAEHERSYYSDKEEFETLVMEILQSYDEKIDFSEFDSDKDGFIDCLSIGVPINGTDEDNFWYGCQATWHINSQFNIDGVKIKKYIINDGQPSSENIKMYNSILSHEIGHCLGLPDYYKYNTKDWHGMKGEAGYERMDDCKGDFSAFSKLLYGWIDKKDVQVVDLNKESYTYNIYPSNERADCLIVPVGKLDKNFLSEYFLIEYITPTYNNDKLFDKGGVRILHIDATTTKSPYNKNYKIFKYENYSPYYDLSNDEKRIIKLVNDGNGFYKSGDIVEFGDSNFAAYDSEGNQTIDLGIRIGIGEEKGGYYPITITKTK